MNLLITGAWQEAEAHLDELRAMGHEIEFLRQEKDALPCKGSWVEGIVCNGLFLHHELDEVPRLRYLQLTSAGLDRIPLERMRLKGVRIHNARGVYSVPMAEHAVWGVLSLYRRAPRMKRSASRRYRQPCDRPLSMRVHCRFR